MSLCLMRSGHRIACAGCLVSWAGTTVLPLLGAGPGDVLQVSVRPGISNSKHITSVLIIITTRDTRNLITVSENGARRTDQSVSPAIPLVTRERDVAQIVKLVLTISKHGNIN